MEKVCQLGGPDGGHRAREAGGDGDEDQDGHAVAHAALGDLLPQPHDDGDSGGHHQDHQQDGRQRVVRDDGDVALQQAPVRAMETSVVACSAARAMVM